MVLNLRGLMGGSCLSWSLDFGIRKEEISNSDPIGIDAEFNTKYAFSEKCMLSRLGT